MIKTLIDIPERMDKLIHSDSQIDWLDMSHVLHVVKNGIVLDGLTNGEVMQKIFPDAKISFEEEWDSYDDGDFCNSYVERFVNVEFEHAQTLTFSLDWWNRKWGE